MRAWIIARSTGASLPGMRERSLHGIVRRRQRHLPAERVIANPGQIIVGPRGVADAPVRHGAFAVVLQRLLKALDRFSMVEPKQPVEAAVEPKLGVRRRRGDFAAVRPEIEIGQGVCLHLHDRFSLFASPIASGCQLPGLVPLTRGAGQAPYHFRASSETPTAPPPAPASRRRRSAQTTGCPPHP